jgi:hypothetical protein
LHNIYPQDARSQGDKHFYILYSQLLYCQGSHLFSAALVAYCQAYGSSKILDLHVSKGHCTKHMPTYEAHKNTERCLGPYIINLSNALMTNQKIIIWFFMMNLLQFLARLFVLKIFRTIFPPILLGNLLFLIFFSLLLLPAHLIC